MKVWRSNHEEESHRLKQPTSRNNCTIFTYTIRRVITSNVIAPTLQTTTLPPRLLLSILSTKAKLSIQPCELLIDLYSSALSRKISSQIYGYRSRLHSMNIIKTFYPTQAWSIRSGGLERLAYNYISSGCCLIANLMVLLERYMASDKLPGE